jgi:hypothetical protein
VGCFLGGGSPSHFHKKIFTLLTKKIKKILSLHMLQLNPMIPIYSIEHEMEGYAFLVIDYSQEHDLLFTCALSNGEIWTISNKKLRFCKNLSLDRKKPSE